MIDLVALDALRAVGTHGSVVAAADALGFTPSAVSQQVKRLEKQTGVPLLERVGRGVMLTRHGRHLVEQGTRLLDDLEELQSGLHQQAGHRRRARAADRVLHRDARPGRPRPAARPGRAPGPARQPHRAGAVGHRQPGRLRAGRPRRRAQLGRPAAGGPRPPGPHRPRPRPRRGDRPPRPPPGRPRRRHPPRPGRRGLDRHPRGDHLPAVAAADVRRDRPAAAGSRTSRWSSTATWPWSAPGSASR